MRRFRNPRYAPESLERKLSPSGFAPPPADVSCEQAPADSSGSSATCDYSQAPSDPSVYSGPTSSGYSAPEPPPENPYPTVSSPGDPPPSDPDYPNDPEGPAYTHSEYAVTV